MKEKRAVKFYLDESINTIKKERIIGFLKECQEVENQLLEYYWKDDNFKIIIDSFSQIDFNYKNKINFRDTTPQLKSHHFQQVLQKAYTTLKGVKNKIIKRIHFKFDDKIEQRVYNYCSNFCFDWTGLIKYNEKQIKSFKRKDENYYKFLLEVNKYIINEELFNKLREDVETRFWTLKSEYKLPVKKEFQILCNTAHTVDIELKEFQWIFIIDSNSIIGGCDYRPIFDELVIPVKYSDYHKKVLEDKTLINTFNLRLNKYNKIEIIATYEIEIEHLENISNNTIGIDIGLKKLIMCSDGEVIEQNKKILYKLSKVVKKQRNRQTLEKHIQKKYNDDTYRLKDTQYISMQTKLSTFVKTDNMYKIKQFLKGRENDLIIMENLDIGHSRTHNKETNYLLKRLGIQGIKNGLLEYCKKQGINIKLINPAFTSQQCPICNHTSKENRKTQEMFSCVGCGYSDNADHNASINIMNRYKDIRININTPVWKVGQILGVEGY